MWEKLRECDRQMTEDLAALLVKLKQLDPATHDAFHRQFSGSLLPAYASMADTLLPRDDILAGCIQRVCDARSWYWQAGHGNHIGYVAAVKDGAKLVYGSSPCHALLAAYISALESKH